MAYIAKGRNPPNLRKAVQSEKEVTNELAQHFVFEFVFHRQVHGCDITTNCCPSPASQLIHSQRCGASQSPRFWQGWMSLPSTAQIPFWEGWSAASLKMACCPLLDTRFWVESPAKCIWMVTPPASSRLGCEFCGLRPISILQTIPLDAVGQLSTNCATSWSSSSHDTILKLPTQAWSFMKPSNTSAKRFLVFVRLRRILMFSLNWCICGTRVRPTVMHLIGQNPEPDRCARATPLTPEWVVGRLAPTEQVCP